LMLNSFPVLSVFFLLLPASFSSAFEPMEVFLLSLLEPGGLFSVQAEIHQPPHRGDENAL